MILTVGHAVQTAKQSGFFLKISKEIGKAWRKSLTRVTQSPLCFQPRSRPFV